MDEKFVREAIKYYDAVDIRAREVLIKLGLEIGWVDKIEFDEEEINYTLAWNCCNETNYDYETLPLKYLWMDDKDVVEDYVEMKRKEREEQLRMEKVREEAKQAAMEREERATYERLKAKFENE